MRALSDAERVHRLADDGFSQDRPDGRLAVAATRKRRPSGALERDVAALAVAINDLAKQQRAAIAERRRETAELVPRIRLSDGREPSGASLPEKIADP